jgi:hypothetical protein
MLFGTYNIDKSSIEHYIYDIKDKKKDQQGKGDVQRTQPRHTQVGHSEGTKPTIKE